jgi:hypothetical protein
MQLNPKFKGFLYKVLLVVFYLVLYSAFIIVSVFEIVKALIAFSIRKEKVSRKDKPQPDKVENH